MTTKELIEEIDKLKEYRGLIGLVDSKPIHIVDSNGDELNISNIRTSNDGLFIEVEE